MLEALAGSGAGILLIGLLIGMQHALEADHVAAVSSIAARQTKFRNIVRHGAVWGLGHTVTLKALSGGAIAFGVVLNDHATEVAMAHAASDSRRRRHTAARRSVRALQTAGNGDGERL